MKLSKKGFYKILSTCSFDEELAKYSLKYSDCNKDYFFEVEEVDFEPDDFEGIVCLSVEEAKALLRRIPEFKESSNWQLPIETLKHRIKQAEERKNDNAT